VSVQATAAAATAVLRRFPMTLLAAVIATVAMIAEIHSDSSHLQRLIIAAMLGLSSLTAVALAGERMNRASWVRQSMVFGVALLLIVFYFISLHWTDSLLALRTVQFALVAHLLVAVLPYVAGPETAGFWQFNRILFTRFLLASLYTAVLWAGLSVALLAVHELFGVTIVPETYGYLWAVMALLVHPWILLAGIPSDYTALDSLDEYPRAIRIFAQFILLPLIAVYLVILYIYLGRIILTAVWPSGWIGYLVSSVSAVGVLALLLVHPARGQRDAGWVARYSRWFFAVMLPPLVMLFLAIGGRIAQYGVTEPRYFLLVLAIWFSALALYYTIRASSTIREIPFSLMIVAAMTSFGPWGAYQWSRRSQLDRLAQLATRNGLGAVGSLHSTDRVVPRADAAQLSGIFDYLYERDGYAGIRQAVGGTVDTTGQVVDERGTHVVLPADGAMRHLGLKYVNPQSYGLPGSRDATYRTFTVNDAEPLQVSGFDVAREVWIQAGERAPLGVDSLTLVADSALRNVRLVRAKDTVGVMNIADAVAPVVVADRDSLQSTGTYDVAPVIDLTYGSTHLRLVVRSFTRVKRDSAMILSGARGFILIRR
jgi:hypothetical protein